MDDKSHSPSIQNVLEQHKDASIQKLVVGLFYLTVVAVFISLSRFYYTGWQSVFTFQFCGFLVMSGLFFFRHKINSHQAISVIILLACLITTTGMITFGIYSNSALWGVFTLYLAINYWSSRATLILGLLIVAVFFTSAVRFVELDISFPSNPELYITQWPSWLVVFFGCGLFMVLIAHVVRGHQQLTERLLVDLENKNKEIEYLANYDQLTGLPVIRLFMEAVRFSLLQKKREDRTIAILFIDLDDFKSVNDQHGHDAGDYVLTSVAKRISQCIRQEDMAARMGGDEFVILINSALPVDLKILCQRLIKSISLSYDYKGDSLNIGASIGVATLDEQKHIEDPKELIRQADQAMYQAKRMGKNDFFISHY